ncbi:MAG TPA: hypothetical protein VJ808_11525 [Gemmatimonadales bacterium]|nr:hypothetical protein [Gemmatimonadales bacterium]
MRHLLILAAAAFLAVGCHQRTEDEAGAAPDQGDPTVTATDTSTTVETDSTMGQLPSETDTSFVTPDTMPTDPGMTTDTVGAQGEVQMDDTTSADTWTDTTTTETTTDTTAADTYDTTADTTSQQ